VVGVLLVNAIDRMSLEVLLDRYGLELRMVAPDEVIPGSYWGEREAGLIGAKIFARLDTPLHSVLHESAHFICMTPERRAGLDTDAGGDDAEESAVCYLQVLLAETLPNVGRERMCRDMDEWGYSFRLGSTAAWFGADAEDSRDWLIRHGLLDRRGCRGAPHSRASLPRLARDAAGWRSWPPMCRPFLVPTGGIRISPTAAGRNIDWMCTCPTRLP
jgi:hypothetical protein